MNSTQTKPATRNASRLRRAVWVSAVLALGITLASVHGFLAISSPSGKGLLVVEAWIPKQSLADSVQVFRQGHYDNLVLVGGPIGQAQRGHSGALTYADSAETYVKLLSLDPAKIVKIGVAPASNRTFSTAVAFRNWLQASGTKARSIDVFTAGVHARKSWILFRYALGDGYRVGIIAGPEHSYDPRFWPTSRRGIWIVSRNVAGYLYSEVAILLDAHGWKVLSNN